MARFYIKSGALLVAVVFAGSCRTIQKTSVPAGAVGPTESFCVPSAEKSLSCQVKDVVPRLGSRLDQVRKSDFAKVTQVNIAVFSDESRAEPQIEFLSKSDPALLFRFDRVTDLYQRNGCLTELTGGIFSEGFTPRVSLKVLISAGNSDHPAAAEISDFRHSAPLHLSLDLYCERKQK